MFGIGGGGNFLSSIGSLVGGLFGGPIGAMVGQLAGQFVSSLLGDAIKGSGLPPFLQGLLQEAVDKAFGQPQGGGSANQLFDAILDIFKGLGAAAIGEMQRNVDQFNDAVQSFLDILRELVAQDEEGNSTGSAGGGRGAGRGGGAGGGQGAGGGEGAGSVRSGGNSYASSWYMALVKAFAEQLQEMAEEIEALQQEMSGLEGEDRVDIQTELQGLSQKFNFAMQSASTSIKSIGEGMTGMARKQ